MMKTLLTITLVILGISTFTDAFAFSANRPYRRRDAIDGPHFLAFRNVIVDSDGAFNEDYGAFRAPDNGYYAFHLCLTSTARRFGHRGNLKVGLYTFSIEQGRQKVLSLSNYNGKCYSTVIYLVRGDFAYNVIESGRVDDNAEEVVFSGYIVGNAGPRKLSDTDTRTTNRFPADKALPKETSGSSGNRGGEKFVPPFLFSS